MTTFSIVCAWKDMGDPHRRAAFGFTRRYWTHHFPDIELVVGCPEPFGRAAGLNEAIRNATGDVILQADPDTIVPASQANLAVAQAGIADGLVVAYDEYLYLNEEGTRRLHEATLGWLPIFTADECQFSGKGGAGPVTAFSRKTWEIVGGYDERFGLWGGDDGAFAVAADAFTGNELRTVEGPALHSYHPRLTQSVPGQEGYVEQFALLAEYVAAGVKGPEFVRALIEKPDPFDDGTTWNG